jgi:hypothetical protein
MGTLGVWTNLIRRALSASTKAAKSIRLREEASHHMDFAGEDVDSEAGDAFMREHKGPK